MILIRFPDSEARRKALGFLARRFSGRSWSTGEIMVPEEALPFLASEGIPFNVLGPAGYDRFETVRDSSPLAVQ
jgi:hypothetical protein